MIVGVLLFYIHFACNMLAWPTGNENIYFLSRLFSPSLLFEDLNRKGVLKVAWSKIAKVMRGKCCFI